ncbi:hypothetical protein QQ045_023676 [Rhodiola kirilowii]
MWRTLRFLLWLRIKLLERLMTGLLAPPDEDEIKNAVFGMNAASSPGPDGFSGKFFCACWTTIKHDLSRAVAGFFYGLQLPKQISGAQIILLPKVKNAVSFDKVRPISLCNFIHKIISRILNDRLKVVLPSLISEEQAGFIEGRNIHETIGLAHDIVNDINNKTFGGNMVVKFDMSKAYDRLSWRFILKMMRAYGFSERWCDLVYRNISNCWYSICWDGNMYGHFKSNRGVRQGDPLSPSLFILAMEFFSKSLNSAVSMGKIRPYRTKGCRPQIHHLLYADDLLIFTNGHKNSVANLLEVVNNFCKLSGQLLNPEKSMIYFADNIPSERRKNILDLTKFSEGIFPVDYLGAPLFPGRAKLSYFKHLEEVVKTKIASWAKNFLNMAGRATLISTVLGSMTVHTLSILPVPKLVLQGIERLMRNFLWDRGSASRHHWVSWEKICRPKEEGGLGIRRLEDVKKCLLTKLAWRFLQNQTIWAKFARKKYLHTSYSSAIWTAIKPYVIKLKEESRWNIGRGDILLSHFCEWGDIKLPKVASSWTIKEVITQGEIRTSCNSFLSAEICTLIDSIQLNDTPDTLKWKYTEDGNFSNKVCYDKIRDHWPKEKLFKHTWRSWIPPKISIFLWRLWHQALPTDDNLAKVGISGASKCWFCSKPKSETVEHLFILGEYAAQVWEFLAKTFSTLRPQNLRQLQRMWFLAHNKKDFLSCVQLILAACALWEIWVYRNCKLLNKTTTEIKPKLASWGSSLWPLIKADYQPSFEK